MWILTLVFALHYSPADGGPASQRYPTEEACQAVHAECDLISRTITERFTSRDACTTRASWWRGRRLDGGRLLVRLCEPEPGAGV